MKAHLRATESHLQCGIAMLGPTCQAATDPTQVNVHDLTDRYSTYLPLRNGS